MNEKIKTAVMEVIKAHMVGEDKNTKAVLSDVMQSVNELETLEQEPCDDAISRDAAITIAGTHTLTVDETVKALEQLPSVTQKSGKCKTCKYWQDNNNGYPSDMCKWRTDETPDADDYCSEYEPQESEDKE